MVAAAVRCPGAAIGALVLAIVVTADVCATPRAGVSSRSDQRGVAGLETAMLRGGVEGVRRGLGDRVPMLPATAVVDLTRRFYGGTDRAADRDAGFARFRTWLRDCAEAACDPSILPPDPVPLPGSVEFWRQSGLDGVGDDGSLVLSILDSRAAALLYTALLSMEPATRDWFLDRPALVRRLSESDRGVLVVAAPYLRIETGRFQLPGGPRFSDVWVNLVGAPLDAEPGFIEALVRARSGHLAYAVEVIATSSPAQQAAALSPTFVSALGDLVGSWKPGERPFWRPSPDPAFLLAQIAVDSGGRLALPGGRRYWQFVLGSDDLTFSDVDAANAWRDPEPVSPAWLVARMASMPPDGQAAFYSQLLFASRAFAVEDVARAAPVAAAIRSMARLAPLVRTLERLGVGDAVTFAAMARQADLLTRGSDGWRARATLAQWQALLALLDRMGRTGTLSPSVRDAALVSLAAPVTSPADITPLTTWLSAIVPTSDDALDPAARPLERTLIERLTASVTPVRHVEWEGTAYRVDLAAGERDRLAKVRGRDSRPLIDAGYRLATWPAIGTPADDVLKELAPLAAAVGVDRPLEPDDEFGLHAREAATRARRMLVDRRGRTVTADITHALRDLGHALAAAGLVELAYAANMGWADDLPLTAGAASRRHVFQRASGADRDRRWLAPAINADRRFPWHVSGSLLGLDVALAPVAMRRLSLRPLPASPLLNSGDRAVLLSTATTLDPHVFTDDAQRAVQTLVEAGTRRVGKVAGASAARELANDAHLSRLRATLFEWQVVDARPTPAEFFSMAELLRIGLAGEPPPESLRGWGNFEQPLTGRASPGTLPDYPVERYAGRSRRTLGCALPDLQLMLAVRLAELRLPAALVPSLMTSATFDVVNTAPSRYTDDWQAIVSRVRQIDTQAVERYLGLLTTAGPLRLVSKGAAR